MNPFQIQKDVETAIRGEPLSVTSMGRDCLLRAVRTRMQSENMSRLKKVDGKECSVEIHRSLSTSEGIIYVKEFDITPKELESGLGDYAIREIQEATWIKPFNKNSIEFIVTFNQERAPEYSRIPGEGNRTKVYEYKQRPMRCRNCQEYGHTRNRCRSEQSVCG